MTIDPKPRIDRPLIAYAFLAQVTQTPGDLLSGLIPIFSPVVKQHMGEPFDAKGFSREVGQMFGISISPWAVDDLARRLEQAGLLTKHPAFGGAVEYIYAEIKGEFTEVSEGDIRAVVERFIHFATPLLQANGFTIDRKRLERGFFDELITIDFHTILQKPDRAESPSQTENTLALPKSAEEIDMEKELAAKSRLDVLCAAFVVAMRSSDRPVYDLIVRIASAAMVVQVVLNMQDPGETVSLAGLRVVLDAPILMSLIDLGNKDSHDYARQLADQLKEHGALLEVFRHSVEEVADNLKAAVNAAADGSGFGPTVRRLRDSMYSSYVASVRADLEGTIARSGVRIIEPPTRPGVYQYFTEEDEGGVYGMLGHYQNPLAQQRDAASIAAVMRMRQGRHARIGQFHQAQCVFVTENPRVAERAHRFSIIKKLIRESEVPPAMTDRHLAAMVWVLFGGKTSELTEYRLLASCSAALEARNDVSSRVQRFLKQLDTSKADHFRALMTTERSGQYLMQLTLGDSTLIRSTDDADQILAKLREADAEEVRKRSEETVQRVRAEKDAELALVRAASERHADAARAAEADAMLARAQETEARQEAQQLAVAAEERLRREAADRAEEVARIRESLQQERSRRLGEKKPIIRQSMDDAIRRYRQVKWAELLVLFVLTAGAGVLGTSMFTDWNRWLGIVSAIGIGVIAVAFFSGTAADRVFGRWAMRARTRAFRDAAQRLGFEPELEQYALDWDAKTVKLRPLLSPLSIGDCMANESVPDITTVKLPSDINS